MPRTSMQLDPDTDNSRALSPYFSAKAAWAFSLGTSVGWGSFVITSNTYLIQAGPAGSAAGLIIGALIMLVISKNYAYMINRYPESGGAYTYLKKTFGFDHGFLTAWFLILTYLAMLWANATALPIFARYFIGDYFKRWPLHSVFGYDVYLGEALLSVAAILIVAFICSHSRKGISASMIFMGVFFTVAITVCFIVVLLKSRVPMDPIFIPDTKALSQTIRIACISSWAFIGFENISHSVPEFKFKKEKVSSIFRISIITSTALYVFITLLSVKAYPERYSSWLEYIRERADLDGLEALPAFYVTGRYLGRAGITLLILVLLMLILTSLIGNTLALSRLLHAMARDNVIPSRFSEINNKNIPANAVMLTAAVSCIVPFIGRTAIGWIVDVTTLGATMIYGFVSASTVKIARLNNDKAEKITGIIGMIAMMCFAAYLIIPNLFTEGSMETESYFLFVVWSVLGFIFFGVTLKIDRSKRFGQSIIVWVALLSLVLFVSLVWMSRSIREATDRAMFNIMNYYEMAGVIDEESSFVSAEIAGINATSSRCVTVVIGLVALSLGVLLNNYATMSRKAKASEKELGKVRDIANRDPLTGVNSKHAYLQKETDIDHEIESGNLKAFAVVVCDINGLKYINDTLGHKAGDEYIRAGSEMICEIFDHSPVFRTGGDEFVAILTGRDYEDRDELIRELHDRSARNIASGEVVVAGGVSDYHFKDDKRFKAVFERADKLMYEEKQLLKNMGSRTRE